MAFVRTSVQGTQVLLIENACTWVDGSTGIMCTTTATYVAKRFSGAGEGGGGITYLYMYTYKFRNGMKLVDTELGINTCLLL